MDFAFLRKGDDGQAGERDSDEEAQNDGTNIDLHEFSYLWCACKIVIVSLYPRIFRIAELRFNHEIWVRYSCL